MGGLWTNANPQDLPEGSSPRNWDIDYTVGSCFTRAGLASVYSYAGQFVGPRVAQVATDVPEGNPWTNPSGILGNSSYASTTNGTNNVQITAGSGSSSGSGSNPAWANPSNIWGGSSASVVLNQSSSQLSSAPLLALPTGFALPSTATVVGIAVTYDALANYSVSGTATAGPNPCTSGTTSSPPWNSPSNITGAGYAEFGNGTVNTTITSGNLIAKGFSFSVPGGATIISITVSLKKYKSNVVGAGSSVKDSNVQLLKGGVATGSNLAQSSVWPTSPTVFTYGGNLWGTTWTPADLNSANFGVQMSAAVHAGTDGGHPPSGACSANVGFVTTTVTYSTGSGVGNATSTVQLSLNGSPVGTASTSSLSSTLTPYTTGNSSYLWGTSFSPNDINNNLGVVLTANAGSTFAAGSSYSFQSNSLSVTVYYTGGESDALQATTYSYSIPSTSGIAGITTTFKAYSSAATVLSVQLLMNGIPVGIPKTQVLTTTPTVYTLGTPSDFWGASWLYSDINNTGFGYQFIATETGTTFVQEAQTTVYITPGLANFNYVKSYIQNNGQTYTLALDADGIMWQEDVTHLPNELTSVLTGILPGSFAKSATFNNREHIMFSDEAIGTDRPRVYNGVTFDPLSQVGPGAPPTITTSTAATSSPLAVTAYAVSPANVVTFTFTAQGSFVPIIGSLYRITGTGNPVLDGFTFSVLGTPAPTTTSFAAATTLTSGSGSVSALATPTNNYPVSSITQHHTNPNNLNTPPGIWSGYAQNFNGQVALWSAGPGLTQPGLTITMYYGSTSYAVENPGILGSFSAGYPCYVYISGAPIGNGTQLVTGHGVGVPPSETANLPFFTFTTTSSAYERFGGAGGSGPNGPGNDGRFQLSLATIITSVPIQGVSAGSSIQITGASPSQWNNTWTIVDALNSGLYNITGSMTQSGGIAIFQYNNASGSSTSDPHVSAGQIITLTGLTNNVELNTTGVVEVAPAPYSDINTYFAISGFPGTLPNQSTFTPESGQGITSGTKFLIDPGVNFVGTDTSSPIFVDDTNATTNIAVLGGNILPIAAGIRQGVVYFITENEYETAPSSPFIFTTTQDTNQIIASDIPIGPPDTIARALAFTEAGQNGVPGANFYVIENPVTTTVNGVTTTVSSTIINDNTTTQFAFSFTDDVLLNSREIDIQGDDLFNLIELGSSAWCLPYASRMFYGLQLNKLNNFTNLSFDGGYLPNPGGNIQPLGWKIVNPLDQTLLISTVTGLSLYIQNQGTSASVDTGIIYQSAFQDAYLVPIIKTNVAYSVRVAASAPSGLTTGTLTIDLTDYTTNTGFGKTYGSFTVPLSSMTTNIQVFTGTLLTNVFAMVPSSLVLRVFVAGMGPNADTEIDRIEVFPTAQPYLKAQVYGSYVGQSEAIDASSEGGIIDTTTQNAQDCMGGFVLHDLMYLLKTGSMYSVQDNPNAEPGGWALKEVSNKVGAIGISSYDYGEEWAVMACRLGIFGFNGGQPTKITQELWNLWEAINWKAGNTIVLKNDVVSKRLYCAIPLPTGTNPATGKPLPSVKWLPNAPYNPAPTSPNVMLMLNYQGLATFEEMVNSPEVHTTINKIVLPIA